MRCAAAIEIQHRTARAVDHDNAVGGRVHERPETRAIQFHGTVGMLSAGP